MHTESPKSALAVQNSPKSALPLHTPTHPHSHIPSPTHTHTPTHVVSFAFSLSLHFAGVNRGFLSGFVLPVEAQQIDRIMEKFSQRFHQANTAVLSHPDTAYILSFSLIMLNTDLHNPSVKNKMTKQDFVRNNRQIDQGKDLPRQYLEDLYEGIRREQFQYPSKRRATQASDLSSTSSSSVATSSHRSSMSSDPAATSSSFLQKIGSKFKGLNKPRGSDATKDALAAAMALSSTSSSSPSVSASALATSAAPVSGLTKRRSFTFPALPAGQPQPLPAESPGISRSSLEHQLIVPASPAGPKRVLRKSASAPGDLSLLAKSHRLVAQEVRRKAGQAGRKIRLPLTRTASGSCLELASRPFKQPVRQGLLYRKTDVDAEGRKAKARNWKLSWVAVRGFSLCLYTGDLTPQTQGVTADQVRLEKVISLREALCFQEDGNAKREFVFRLVTSSSLSYLFQASSLPQLSHWLHAINHQAAICTAVSLDKAMSSSTVKTHSLSLFTPGDLSP